MSSGARLLTLTCAGNGLVIGTDGTDGGSSTSSTASWLGCVAQPRSKQAIVDGTFVQEDLGSESSRKLRKFALRHLNTGMYMQVPDSRTFPIVRR